jgi:hypothetical protein
MPTNSLQPTAAALFVFGGRGELAALWLRRSLVPRRLWLSENVRRHSRMKNWHISVVLLSLLCVSCAHVSSRPPLGWRVIDVRPHQYYYVVDRMEPDCWRVDIEVTNQTTREVVVDWNRDETAFQADGRWDSLRIAALMPYLGPCESRTFPLFLPQRAEAYRYLMYYKLGCAVYDRQFLIEAKLPR